MLELIDHHTIIIHGYNFRRVRIVNIPYAYVFKPISFLYNLDTIDLREIRASEWKISSSKNTLPVTIRFRKKENSSKFMQIIFYECNIYLWINEYRWTILTETISFLDLLDCFERTDWISRNKRPHCPTCLHKYIALKLNIHGQPPNADSYKISYIDYTNENYTIQNRYCRGFVSLFFPIRFHPCRTCQFIFH